MNFEEAVAYLLSLGHETLAMKFGLRNTELLLKALSNPDKSFMSVQIAGTNGKGSTATMLDSICHAAGIRTGLYTSPHLVSITERITVAGVEIEREEFAHHVTTVRTAAEGLLGSGNIDALPTFFEQITCTALLAFREAGVELAILETGLGGRLDSTTAANASVVGITPIAMDHEEYLGHSIEEIAAEKAAIIRPGVVAVIGQQTREAMAVILDRCKQVGVTPFSPNFSARVVDVTPEGQFRVCLKTETNRYDDVSLKLFGEHQIENAALAVRLAEALQSTGLSMSRSSIIQGLETASHPGRLEIIRGKPSFILDGAHNPAGAQSLRRYLDAFGPRPLTMIFGAMSDKRLDQIGENLFSATDTLILTPIKNPRTASIDYLKSAAVSIAGGEVIVTSSSEEALRVALDRTPASGIICVTGSLYLLGEIRPLIIDRQRTQQT